MLFVFLVLYVVLGMSSLVLGMRRTSRRAIVCGIIALALALVSLGVWALSLVGGDHWLVSFLQLLLSPMPETLTEPGSLTRVNAGSGIPVAVIALTELIGSIIIWAIPVLGLVAAGHPSKTPQV